MDAAAWLKKAEDSSAQLEKRARLQELGNFINGMKTLEELSAEVPDKLAEFFSCERSTIFAIDAGKNELVSMAKNGREIKEIRLARDPNSVAGFVSLTKTAVNLRSVYDQTELARVHPKLRFDDRWDVQTGFRTKSMMTVPIMIDANLMGVLQIMNRKEGGGFFPRDIASAEEVARVVGPAMQALYKIKEQRAQRKAGKWDVLLDNGTFTKETLQNTLKAANAGGTDPGRWMIEKVGVARADVEKSLSLYYGVDFFRFTGKEQIPPELKAKIKADFLKKACAVPVERTDKQLVIVIDDPMDITRTDQLRSLDFDREIVYRIGFRDEIQACIDHAFGQRGDVGLILKELSSDESTGAVDDPGDEDGKVGDSDSAVIKLANQVILDGYRRGASDIHIEPNGKENATMIRFRIDGDCVQYQEIPAQFRSPLVARIKIMAKLDISERRKPQDGKIRFRMADRQIELRVATLPTVNGNEDVVMRILAASKPLPLADMGLSERNVTELKKLLGKPYGLMLVVGPTGSGKTTTLHSALGHINTPDMKIWTAEDPVEIVQAGLRQVQVQPKIGFDFAAAMRAFLRADPDVIMVGEMRDKETASTGVEASLTGHLVFSTLHTNSAPETITRLIDMGVDPFSFADALLGILAQRLARGVCQRCKQEYVASEEEFQIISNAFGEEAVEKRGWKLGTLKLWRGAGCDTCNKTGLKGRLGIHELLVNTDAIKVAVTKHGALEEIRRLAIEGGMSTLLQDGIEKALIGKTDLKQVLAVCSR